MIDNKYLKIKEFPLVIKILIVGVPIVLSLYLFFYLQKLKVYKRIQKDIKTTEYELTKAREITVNVRLPEEKEKENFRICHLVS